MSYGTYMPQSNYTQPPYYMPNLQMPQAQTQQQPMYTAPTPTPSGNSGLIWVQGETGAKSYLVAPGQTVMLMDSEDNRFFLKSSDNSGMPLPLRIFRYSEQTAGEPQKTPLNAPDTEAREFVTREEFDALKAEISAFTAKSSKGKATQTEKEAEKV